MEENLKQQIEERKQEAEKKDIEGRACLIARSLGLGRSLNDGYHTEGDEYTFERDNLFIQTSFGSVGGDGAIAFGGTTIEYQGQVVFKEGGGTLHSYIPGNWEQLLDNLHAEGLAQREKHLALEKKKRDEAAENKDQETRTQWGL